MLQVVTLAILSYSAPQAPYLPFHHLFYCTNGEMVLTFTNTHTNSYNPLMLTSAQVNNDYQDTLYLDLMALVIIEILSVILGSCPDYIIY